MSEQPDPSPPPPGEPHDPRGPHRLPYARRPYRPGRDPSVEQEPHLAGANFTPDPAEGRVPEPGKASGDAYETSVWDEPGLSRELVRDEPAAELTYAHWLETRRAGMTPLRSWSLTLLIALAAGPWAVIGALWGTGQTGFGIMLIVIFAPVTEELMKVAAPLWVVEKRPYLFRGPVQILLCALASGVVFAAIENLLYLYVYIPDASPELARWRWTVGVALHAGCSLIAGLGVMRIWSATMQRKQPPQMTLAIVPLATAAVIHGAYNAMAVVLGVIWPDF